MGCSSNRPILCAENLGKCYGADVITWALRGVDLEVHAGEFIAIVGASGSGKSTLLNLIGALDRPTFGRVWLDGCETTTLDDAGLARLRGDTIGFIFQFHYLLAEFNILENALMPLYARRGRVTVDDVQWVKSLLSRVGLEDKMNRRPSQLSGGQQQRAAIVRALANRPKLILADEPTGNLDSRSGAIVFDTLTELNRRLGMAFVLVTHDDRLAKRADRILIVEDGRIAAEYCGRQAAQVSNAEVAASGATLPETAVSPIDSVHFHT